MSRPIISGRYALGPFRDGFGHCGSTADLFAQVTANAHGSVRLPVDLLAVALNELLEWAFACSVLPDREHMQLEVIEDGQRLRLVLLLPAHPELAAEAARRLAFESADQAREALLTQVEANDAQLQRWWGLYWLRAEFGPLRAGAQDDDGRLRLELELSP